MPKNIVICCDGTGNEYGEQNSNVVKLYQALKRDCCEQVVYYHPGVGTMGAKNALTAFGKWWTKVRGLAFGYGLSENIADAYRFLMQTFEPGDAVFVFGFSRGAYTARALCGLVRMFGVMSPGNEGLIPYAIRVFKRNDDSFLARVAARPSKFFIAAGFKDTFSRKCKPHFVGVWDTVSSVGWILDPIGMKPGSLPYTADLAEVSTVRHAVSIDERRAFFRQNLVHEAPGRDIKQVWFAGVHSDVGGSYPEGESGLSKISLRWMLREAESAGLLLDTRVADAVLGAKLEYVPPLANAMMHNSLTGFWRLGEFWPKWTKRQISPPGIEPPKFRGGPRLNLFRCRTIKEGSRIHESVFERRKLVSGYAPRNLPHAYTVESEPAPVPYPVHLNPGESLSMGVHADAKWNDTTLQLRKGERYDLRAARNWYDASICSSADGYPSGSLFFRLCERFRRVPKANWFALIGGIGQTGSGAFVIGHACEFEATEDGILYCFANDLPFMYWNNSGWLELTATRVS